MRQKTKINLYNKVKLSAVILCQDSYDLRCSFLIIFDPGLSVRKRHDEYLEKRVYIGIYLR